MYITLERELDEPFMYEGTCIYISVYTEYDVHSINEYYQRSVTYEIDNIECCDKDGDIYTLSAKARETFINHMDSGIKQQLQDFAEMNSDFTDEEIQDEIREAM